MDNDRDKKNTDEDTEQLPSEYLSFNHASSLKARLYQKNPELMKKVLDNNNSSVNLETDLLDIITNDKTLPPVIISDESTRVLNDEAQVENINTFLVNKKRCKEIV